jgi:hypothetical protein
VVFSLLCSGKHHGFSTGEVQKPVFVSDIEIRRHDSLVYFSFLDRNVHSAKELSRAAGFRVFLGLKTIHVY